MHPSDVLELLREGLASANLGLATRQDLERLESTLDEVESLVDELEEKLVPREQ